MIFSTLSREWSLQSMTRNLGLTLEEIGGCVDFIIGRERAALQSFGFERRLRRCGSRPYQWMLRLFSILGVWGLLCMYVFRSIKKPKLPITIYNKNILISDHSNHLVKKRILQNDVSICPAELETLTVRIPRTRFFNLRQLIQMLRSYYRSKPISSVEGHALISFWRYYIITSYIFEFQSVSAVLIVDDFSPFRVAISLSANLQGKSIGLVRMSDDLNRETPPLFFEILFCWNRFQADEMKGKVNFIANIPRSISVMRLLSNGRSLELKAGIALNAYSEKNLLTSFLEQLKRKNLFNFIKIRPHPGLDISSWKLGDHSVSICSASDSVRYFLKDVDIVFCGNTSVIKEILFLGIPVAYSCDLDPSLFDTCGYVRSGIVYDLNESDFNIIKINSFYSDPTWRKKLSDIVEPHPDSLAIDRALAYLCRAAEKKNEVTGQPPEAP